MKKAIALFLLLVLFLSACTSTYATQNNSLIYSTILDELRTNQADLYYYVKDIDGNNVADLIVLENTKLSVYSYENSVNLIGEHDFITGTVRFFSSDSNSFPGIFYFTVSGGINHYGYMTIENGNLSFEKLWEEDYSTEEQNNAERITELSSNKELISESKRLYIENADIKFALLK